MPDVPIETLEAEQDFEYSYSQSYSYGSRIIAIRGTGSATLAAGGSFTATGAFTGVATPTLASSGTFTGTGAFFGTSLPQLTASSTETSIETAFGLATATLTSTGVLPDATSDVTPIQWKLTIDGSTEIDGLYDVEVEDTFNPFGDYAIAKVDDETGTIFDQITRGTRIELAVSTNDGISFSNQFEGYAVETRELAQQGADALEIEAYTLDQFLRRNQVSNDQSGKALVDALEDIIKTDTPVDWNAANVTVGDSQELTRSLRGVPVERALRDLSFASVNEAFGVNSNNEFFFRPRETEHIDRGVTNTQWFNYDIPELGKETVNEVEVWFDSGNESVIVDNSEDKLDVQDSLNLSEPGTQRAEINRPALTDISDAEDAGRQYLQFRNNTLTGTVTTFGLFNAEPGDTINVTIDPRGIDTEFTIAAINYKWGVDETELTIVERKGNDNSEVLFRLTEAVDRLEMQDADRDAPKNRITTTEATALINVTGDADGDTPTATRFTNDGRNGIRDGWIGDGNIDVAEVVVGDDNSGLSRSNTDLKNQTASASASETLPDSTSVQYSASITQSDVAEIGLKESDGTLIARAILDNAVDVSGSVSLTLNVSNDTSVSRGVLTNGGQTATRDIIADNSPNLPDQYAYGSDGTAPTESDTTLGNELIRVGLKEIQVQSADTNSEWNNIVSLANTDPLAVQNDRLELLQASFTTESDNLTNSGTALQQNTDFSNDEAERIEGSGDTLEVTFSVDYTIPASDVGVWVRLLTGGGQTGSVGPELTLSLNGDTWTPISSNAGFTTLSWRDLANDPAGASGTYSGGDLTPGTYTLTIEGTSTGDGQDIDVVAPLDNRFGWTFDDNTTNSGERVEGPELYPDQFVKSLSTASTQRNIDEARFDSSWNNITNNQFVELANDGSTFTRFNNSDSGTATFGSEEQGVDSNLAFSRFGTDTNSTPTTGRQGQYIDTWDLFVTVIAVATDDIGAVLSRGIVEPGSITGNTVREAGIFGDGTLLTRHEIAEFTVQSGQRVASAETTRFNND